MQTGAAAHTRAETCTSTPKSTTHRLASRHAPSFASSAVMLSGSGFRGCYRKASLQSDGNRHRRDKLTTTKHPKIERCFMVQNSTRKIRKKINRFSIGQRHVSTGTIAHNSSTFVQIGQFEISGWVTVIKNSKYLKRTNCRRNI